VFVCVCVCVCVCVYEPPQAPKAPQRPNPEPPAIYQENYDEDPDETDLSIDDLEKITSGDDVLD
jgi:hypothetical protein